jgi:hypothetical protein
MRAGSMRFGDVSPLEGGIIIRDYQEYLSWLCAMMHEMHHSVLLAQWSAEVRHTLTLASVMCLRSKLRLERR